MTAGENDEGGDVEMSSPEYCSLSDRIVTPDSAMGFGASSEDMVLARPSQVGLVVGARVLGGRDDAMRTAQEARQCCRS